MSLRPIFISFLLGAGILVTGCGGPPPDESEVLRPVVSQVVGYEGGETTRTFSGSAVTGRTVNLSFRSGGIVTRLDMVVGAVVRRGQLLGELDNVTTRLAYEQAVVGLNSAESQMNTAELALDRTRALYEAGTASLSDYENARNAFQTAEAGYESAQRTVAIQEEQVSYGFIYAPESGTIASVNVELDETVSPGQIVAVLNAGEEIEIDLGLPESVISRVTAGMEASVNFPALPGVDFAGRVTEVSPSVSRSSATYPVRVRLENPSPAVRSGMAARVTLDLRGNVEPGDALTVPAKAVGEDESGHFVFLLEPEEGGVATAHKRRVTIGPLTTAGFEIADGLTAGQRIATAGLQNLLDGQRVRIR